MMHNGGLVNQLPKDAIFDLKTYDEMPEEVYERLKILQFPKKDKIISSITSVYGSSRLKIQPYYGDIDSINVIKLDETNFLESCKIIEKKLQERVKNVLEKGFFITDIKCGRYKTGKSIGKAIHWTFKELLIGIRNGNNPDVNGNIGETVRLIDAISQNPEDIKGGEPAMMKIDMIAPFSNRYMEITTIYLIISTTGTYFFFPVNYLESRRILSSLIDDVGKQIIKKRAFKIAKRLFSILRVIKYIYKNDEVFKYVNYITPIIGTNISRVSSVYSDLGNLLLLYQTNQKNIDKKYASNSVQFLKDKLNVIIDLYSIRINLPKLRVDLDNISNLILENADYKKIINDIEKLRDLLNSYIIRELYEYGRSKNLSFKDYTNNVIIFARRILKEKNIITNFFNIGIPSNKQIENMKNFYEKLMNIPGKYIKLT